MNNLKYGFIDEDINMGSQQMQYRDMSQSGRHTKHLKNWICELETYCASNTEEFLISFSALYCS